VPSGSGETELDGADSKTWETPSGEVLSAVPNSGAPGAEPAAGVDVFGLFDGNANGVLGVFFPWSL